MQFCSLDCLEELKFSSACVKTSWHIVCKQMTTRTLDWLNEDSNLISINLLL
jgi:uncharacterized protein (DUF2237 family)